MVQLQSLSAFCLADNLGLKVTLASVAESVALGSVGESVWLDVDIFDGEGRVDEEDTDANFFSSLDTERLICRRGELVVFWASVSD